MFLKPTSGVLMLPSSVRRSALPPAGLFQCRGERAGRWSGSPRKTRRSISILLRTGKALPESRWRPLIPRPSRCFWRSVRPASLSRKKDLRTVSPATRRWQKRSGPPHQAWGLSLFPKLDAKHEYANTVTAISYPEGVKDDDVRATIKKMGIIIAGGQDLKGKISVSGHGCRKRYRDPRNPRRNPARP